jgi:valyl-tRNA synthetase
VTFEPRRAGALALEDRWILSRLASAIAEVERSLEEYNPAAAIGSARDFFWSELCDWYLEFIKPRMRDESQAASARQVLATAIDQVTRLLHPFIPFVTESIWEKLNEQAPTRGIEEPLPMSDMVIRAAWPQAHPAWRDAAIEEQFEFLRDVVRGIRDIRNKYNVPPSRRLGAGIRVAGASLDLLRPCLHLIQHMAGLASLDIGAAVERPGDAASAVVRDAEVYVCGVVDTAQEKVRLAKQRDQLAAQVSGIEKKLSNEGFVSKAPPDVVERERARMIDLKAQLDAVAANLAALGG